MEQKDFLVVGHITRDLVPGGSHAGGTAVYSSQTAQVLGCKTAVLTSTEADFDISQVMAGIDVHRIPAQETTTFENVYTPTGRVQTVHGLATYLTAADIPESWTRANVVHLAPIASEVDPEMIHVFSNSLVGLTIQGWLRRWEEDGRVFAREWEAAEHILPLAAAVILSQEDLLDDAMLQAYKEYSRLLVLTQAAKGCIVFFGGEERLIPTLKVTEVEPTGAGDIFAAAFMTRLHQTAGNPWEAARFANEIAAQSVTQATLAGKIAQIKKFRSERR